MRTTRTAFDWALFGDAPRSLHLIRYDWHAEPRVSYSRLYVAAHAISSFVNSQLIRDDFHGFITDPADLYYSATSTSSTAHVGTTPTSEHAPSGASGNNSDTEPGSSHPGPERQRSLGAPDQPQARSVAHRWCVRDPGLWLLAPIRGACPCPCTLTRHSWHWLAVPRYPIEWLHEDPLAAVATARRLCCGTPCNAACVGVRDTLRLVCNSPCVSVAEEGIRSSTARNYNPLQALGSMSLTAGCTGGGSAHTCQPRHPAREAKLGHSGSGRKTLADPAAVLQPIAAVHRFRELLRRPKTETVIFLHTCTLTPAGRRPFPRSCCLCDAS